MAHRGRGAQAPVQWLSLPGVPDFPRLGGALLFSWARAYRRYHGLTPAEVPHDPPRFKGRRRARSATHSRGARQQQARHLRLV
jgi:hypothetical protein